MLRFKPFRFVLILVIGITITAFSIDSKRNNTSRIAKKIASMYEEDISQLDKLLAGYTGYFPDSSYAMRLFQYRQLVYQWKKVECLFTYFHPSLTYETFLKTPQFEARDFGPPFPDNWLFVGPFGIEPDSVLKTFSKTDSVFTNQFIGRSTKNFKEVLARSSFFREIQSMTDSEIFDALRLQMVRISTIGLANGDFVIKEAALPALRGAFDSWTEIVWAFAQDLGRKEQVLKNALSQNIQVGKKILGSTNDFDSLNHMEFLTEALIPLSSQLTALRNALHIQLPKAARAVNENVDHVYAEKAFDANYFAPGEEAYLSRAKVELGRFLFFDPVLSDNNERACASCHKPELAFTDGTPKSLNFDRGDLPRNAPTVINAAFQKHQFWDLRSNSLEDQLDSVINSPDELHSSFENVIGRLSASDEYVRLFHAAFPETKKKGIERKHVKIAIACYERELTGMNTRFDKYVRGDRQQLNAAEIHGFNLFMGKAKCGTCHYAPLFNGALPPYFDFTDHRSLGIPVKDSMAVYQIDADTGFSRASKNKFDHFSFKIPTVRNAAFTAPYMHNGVYKTLEQVVEFYDHAGGVKFTRDMRPGMKGLPFFLILPEQLKLTEQEKKDVVSFIRALNDTSSFSNVPAYLPALGGKYAHLNQRKLGGIY